MSDLPGLDWRAGFDALRLTKPVRTGYGPALSEPSAIREIVSAALKGLADDLDDLPALVRLAARLEPGMRRAFLDAARGAQGRIDLERLAQALAAGSVTAVEAAAEIAFFESALGPAVTGRLKRGFLLGASLAHGDLQRAGLAMRFDLINPYAVAWTEAHAAELVTGVTAETREAIRALVERAFREGLDPARVARELRDVVGLTARQAWAVQNFRERLIAEGVPFDKMMARAEKYAQAQLRRRAETVSRNELLTASNEGQQALWLEAKNQGLLNPQKTRRVWLVTHDDRLEARCFPARTSVLTLEGWKYISRVKAGDFVLTHEDRFRSVMATRSRHYDGKTVRILFGGRSLIKATATYGHRVLTQRGWIAVEELTLADEIAVHATPCPRCGSPIPTGPKSSLKYCGACSRVIPNEKRWANPAQHELVRRQNLKRWSMPGAREAQAVKMASLRPSATPSVRLRLSQLMKDRIARNGNISSRPDIREKLRESMRRRYRNGGAEALAQGRTKGSTPFHDPAVREKATAGVRRFWSRMTPEQRAGKLSKMLAGCTKVSRGRSSLEVVMRRWLDAQAISYVAQWPFTYENEGRQRQGFADFFIPGANLVVECDGYFHFRGNGRERDQERDAALQAQGVTVLRFDGKMIQRRFDEVASAIRQYCCTLWLRPKKLVHRTMRHQPVYDLTVAEDHSFIAGGITAHNCEALDEAEAELSGPFPGGIMRPPLHVACRCTTALKFLP